MYVRSMPRMMRRDMAMPPSVRPMEMPREAAACGIDMSQSLIEAKPSSAANFVTSTLGMIAWTRLAMACQTVDAQQAREIGLVQAVYPQAEFAARARAFAEQLASFPREAVGLAKLAIDAASRCFAQLNEGEQL